MKLALKKYWQRDPKWGGEKLGTGSGTIADVGCAITCLAMVEDYYGFNTDPQRINQLLIKNKCYANKNLLDFTKIDKINEFVTFKERVDCETKPAPLEKVDLELNEGRPVITRVDLNPNEPGSDHFVVIIGKTEDGHYLALDPWYDEGEIFFDARYGEPSKGIFGLRLINGPVPKPPETQPNISDLQGQITQWQQHFDDLKEHLRPAGIVPGDDLPKVIGAIDELISIKKKYENLPDPIKPKVIQLLDDDLKYFRWNNLIIGILTDKGKDKL